MPRQLTSSDFVPTNDTRLSIGILAPGQDIPVSVSVTTSAAVLVNATSIPVTALTQKLYEGSILKFGTVEVELTADALPAATSLAVLPVPGAIALGDAAVTLGLIPIFSVKQADTSIGENSINSRNFASGLWQSATVTMRNGTIACNGTFVKNDPGIQAVRQSKSTRGRVYFEVIEGTGDGEQGAAFVTGYQRNRQVDDNIMVSFTLTVDGPLTDIYAA
jgi:hypothetical protein